MTWERLHDMRLLDGWQPRNAREVAKPALARGT